MIQCPKYIVDVMSPSISTLVEDENKKTARYYASINDYHYSISGQTVVRLIGQVSSTQGGDVSY
jgi:hypothetical protein